MVRKPPSRCLTNNLFLETENVHKKSIRTERSRIGKRLIENKKGLFVNKPFEQTDQKYNLMYE